MDDYQFANCSVRTPRWHLVSAGKGKKQQSWQLFDLTADPGEKTDVLAAHPDVVKTLTAEYDAWWKALPPYLVNEDAEQPTVKLLFAQYATSFDVPSSASTKDFDVPADAAKGPKEPGKPAGFIQP